MVRLWMDLLLTFFRIGAFTLGGGYAMIPLIEREIVDKRRWITREDIVDIFAVSQSIPGAIAINSATFIGYRTAGYAGALWATLGVVLPSFIIITVIAMVFVAFQDLPVVKAAFLGVNATVVSLIAIAAIRLGKTAIKDKTGLVIMAAALILMLILKVHVILIIVLGALTGLGLTYGRKKDGSEIK